ncbi:MAG: NAD(P)H-hydrate epimerase, partial [Eubacteriales bacterium]|nr:NAD(P)H-hydrate epimerase [Eubacteriales bacterium]
MKLVTPKQMSQIDRIAIEKFGIPGIVLMENAALTVVSEVMNVIGDTGAKKAVVVCGKGNNGGDGFAIARHLHLKGINSKIYLVASKAAVFGDALINLKIAEKLGISVIEICGDAGVEAFKQSFKNDIMSNCVIVDALFGTGFKGEVSGPACDVINIINSACCHVISVDIPSGVNGETGEAGSVCIEADRTVTLGFPKVGLVIAPGCEKTGKLSVADIGIPPGAVDGNEINTFLLDREELKGIVCKRKNESNKGDYGRVLIITGSTGMTGAGSLAASSALRVGAGLVYIAAPQSLTKIYACNVVEAIQLPLEDEGAGFLSAKCTRQLEKALEGKTAVAIGPGLSTAGDVSAVVRFVLENANI